MVKTFKQFFQPPQQDLDESFKPVPVAPTAQQLGIKMKGGFAFHPSVKPVEEEDEPLVPLVKVKRERD